MTSRKLFSEIIELFWTTYMRKVHIQKNVSLVHQTAEIWGSEIQIHYTKTKPSQLVLVHFIWNWSEIREFSMGSKIREFSMGSKIREFSMGLYANLSGSIYTFSGASDLKFGINSSASVFRRSFVICPAFFYCGFKVTLNKKIIPEFELDFDCMSLSSEYEFEFETKRTSRNGVFPGGHPSKY